MGTTGGAELPQAPAVSRPPAGRRACAPGGFGAPTECHGVREYAFGADAVPWPRQGLASVHPCTRSPSYRARRIGAPICAVALHGYGLAPGHPRTRSPSYRARRAGAPICAVALHGYGARTSLSASMHRRMWEAISLFPGARSRARRKLVRASAKLFCRKYAQPSESR
jgi:hypothetical protein